MKKLVFILVASLSACGQQPTATSSSSTQKTQAAEVVASSYWLATSCSVNLTATDPNSPNIGIETAGRIFPPTADGFAKSVVSVSFPPYMVGGWVELASSDTPSGEQPTFVTTLVDTRVNDPIAGQVNYASAAGLDLDNRSLNTPLTLTGRNIVQIQYNGQNFSRIDYTCSLTKSSRATP